LTRQAYAACAAVAESLDAAQGDTEGVPVVSVGGERDLGQRHFGALQARSGGAVAEPIGLPVARSFKTNHGHGPTVRVVVSRSGSDWTVLSAAAGVHRDSVVTLLLASLAIMGSPGPSTISLVAAGIAYGPRDTVRYCAGLIVGTTAVLLAVGAGLTAALLAIPGLRWALLLVAAGYVLWLAVHLALAPPLNEQRRVKSRPSFIDGAVLGVVNPKAWIAVAAVFASARLAQNAVTDAALKFPLLTLMIIAIHVGWLLAGRLLLPALRVPALARAVNLALAVVLVAATAISLSGTPSA
jgi:threonine/homoserine/homoserine lactone efflux protein